MQNKNLPIYEMEDELFGAMAVGSRAVIEAPTGSGKSTQIPQILLDRGLVGSGQIIVLQPRRLPTRMLAARVAEEREVPLGSEVGYQIRLDNVSCGKTRIKYVTEGILLRQMLSDPELKAISAIIFDEFHERHLYGDITLARAVHIQESTRPDLKLIVMSATLDTGHVEQYLESVDVLTSRGRTFPVDIRYLDRKGPSRPRADDRVWELAEREFTRVVGEGVEGDFLIFMPGAYEISRTVDAIRHSSAGRDFLVFPLHGEMQPKAQDEAVARYYQRKVVVSTNVAESSLTIDGVRVVIDGGLARIPRYDPHRGINTLLIEKISHASADQRAGRAGRTAPGVCVRLWTEQDHAGRPLQEVPEVKRLDLAEVALTLKASGVNDLKTFRWVDPPDEVSLERAELLLRDLGALDARTGDITDVGRRMLTFPVHPRYARMLLAAEKYGCVRAVALIAALTQGRDILVRSRDRKTRDRRDDLLGEESVSDFFMLMRAWRYADRNRYNLGKCKQLGIHARAARQVGPLYESFLRLAERAGLHIAERAADDSALQKCILMGFIDHLACRLDGGTLRCRLVHGRRGDLARESAVHDASLFVAADIREIGRSDGVLNVLLTLATAVEEEWLRELAPHAFEELIDVAYDPSLKRVVARRERRFYDLVLESKVLPDPPADKAAEILATEVVKGNLKLKKWDQAVEQWIARLNTLARACPGLEVPPITEDDRQTLVEQICLGAVSYKDIKEKPVWPVLKSWLGAAQQSLVDKYAPERIPLPNGRKAKVQYSDDASPYISQRIQDLYDVNQTPAVAMGRVPVVVHILGPNHRPVQVTQDMKRFWTEHYPRIKKEMQRRYPKHEWR